MDGVPLPPGIPGFGGSTDPLEAVLGPFPCARLRNLPYGTTVEEILILFRGLVLIDVVLLGHSDAFVIFANPMDYQMGLQRHRQTIGRSFVDIVAGSRAEYYETIATLHYNETNGRETRVSAALNVSNDERGDVLSGDIGLWTAPESSLFHPAITGQFSVEQRPPPLMAARGSTLRGALHAPVHKRTGGGLQVGDHTGFLRMRGLPFAAAKEDIVQFFAAYNPLPDSVVLTYRNDGRPTGEAYVSFMSTECARRAMEMNRKPMGSRYIELFISNKEEQGRALARFGSR